jgi:hypothetical protein
LQVKVKDDTMKIQDVITNTIKSIRKLLSGRSIEPSLTYGNGDGYDASHKKDGTITKEKQSKNRARNGANKKTTKK